MPITLTTDMVKRRLETGVRDEYHYTGTIMQCIALGLGTLTFLWALAYAKECWHLLTPGIATMFAMLLSHLKWERGVLLTTSEKNIRDSILPMLMGIVEVMLFAVLAAYVDAVKNPSTGKASVPPTLDRNAVVLLWLPLISLHTLFAHLLVKNRLNILTNERFDEDLKGFVPVIREWLESDLKETLILTIICGAAGVTLLLIYFIWPSPWSIWIQFALAIPLAGGMAKVCRDALNEYKQVVTYVLKEKDAPPSQGGTPHSV